MSWGWELYSFFHMNACVQLVLNLEAIKFFKKRRTKDLEAASKCFEGVCGLALVVEKKKMHAQTLKTLKYCIPGTIFDTFYCVFLDFLHSK